MTRAALFVIAASAALLGACGKSAPVAEAPKTALARPVTKVAVQGDASGTQFRIPRAAVVRRGAETLVFVLDEKSSARARLVRLARPTDKTANGASMHRGPRLRPGGDTVEVLAGLHGDETLVVGDLSAVHDGTRIEPQR